jgi:hypothetical protein
LQMDLLVHLYLVYLNHLSLQHKKFIL